MREKADKDLNELNECFQAILGIKEKSIAVKKRLNKFEIYFTTIDFDMVIERIYTEIGRNSMRID
jgi:uncharacterized lipoprotein YehR (DUF1307 family)